MPNKLVNMQIKEVSSVDKAANGKKFLIIKNADGDDVTKKTLDEVLESKEAKREFWDVIDAFYDSIDTIMYGDEISEDEKAAQLSATAEQLSNKLNSLAPKLAKRLDVDAMITKAKSRINKKNKGGVIMSWEDVLKSIKDEDIRKAVEDKVNDLKSKVEKAADPDNDVINKADLPEPVKKRLEDIEKRMKIAEDIAKRERQERLKVEFNKKAESFATVGEVSKISGILQKASEVGEDFYNDVETVLKSANERLENTDLFKVQGSDHGQDIGDVMSQIEKKADELIQKNSGLTHEKAVAKVLEMNPELYEAYVNGE